MKKNMDLIKERAGALSFTCVSVSEIRLEVDDRTELEDVIVSAVVGSAAVTVIDIVIGKAESDGRRVLIGNTDTIVISIVYLVRVEISVTVAEICAPLLGPLLLSLHEKELRRAVVPRHVLRDSCGMTAGVGFAEAVRIAHTGEGVVLLLVLDAEARELEGILVDVQYRLPSLRAVFRGEGINMASIYHSCSVCNIVKILEVVHTFESDCRREVVRSINAVGIDISIIDIIPVSNNPYTVSTEEEVLGRLPGDVKRIVHERTRIRLFVESGVAADDSLNGEGVPGLCELETVYTVVTERGIVIDVEAVVSFKVHEKTSGTEADFPRKHRIDIHITDTSPIHITMAFAVAFVFASTEFSIEERVLVYLLREEQTEALLVEVGVAYARITISVMVSAGEVRVEPEGSADFPSADAIFENCDSLVEAGDFHAEGVELILELHDEFLEEFEVLLGSLFSVHGNERAGYYRRHLVTGRGLRTLECTIRIAGNDAAGGEEAYRIIGPVSLGDIHKRVRRCKCRGGESHDGYHCQYCHKFLHSNCTTPLVVFVSFCITEIFRLGGRAYFA